jgi:hypothetical protein
MPSKNIYLVATQTKLDYGFSTTQFSSPGCQAKEMYFGVRECVGLLLHFFFFSRTLADALKLVLENPFSGERIPC